MSVTDRTVGKLLALAHVAAATAEMQAALEHSAQEDTGIMDRRENRMSAGQVRRLNEKATAEAERILSRMNREDKNRYWRATELLEEQMLERLGNAF